MGDSRVERVAVSFGVTGDRSAERAWASDRIAELEAAGLLVILPDEATVERIARELCRFFAAQQLDLPHDEYVDRYWRTCEPMARAVLAALGGAK